MFKRALIILTAAFIIAPYLFALSSMTSSISELEIQKNQIALDMEFHRDGLTVTQREIAQLEDEIRLLDENLIQATYNLELIVESLAQTEQELAQTEIELAEARVALEEQFARFEVRLRAMYIQGPIGYLDVVLQAASFSEFLTRMDHMSAIARSDREMHKRLRDAEALIEQKIEDTFRQRNRIDAQRILQEQRLADLDLAYMQKEVFLVSLMETAEGFETALIRLEQADQEIQEAILRLQRQQEEEARRWREAQEAARRAAQAVVIPSGGSMLWPVPGYFTVTSGYGNRRHPFSGRQEFHTGIDIGARSGANVVAAESGMVTMSGWHGGYGQTIVIDHGNGLSTLYAHNSALLAREGQWVNRGDVIARVGSTGISTGPHLHFEIRQNGRHFNPAPSLGI